MKKIAKYFSLLLCFGVVQTLNAASIIFEEEEITIKKKTILIEGGMSMGLGKIQHVRPRRMMNAGTVRVGSEVITSNNRRGTVKAIFLSDAKIVVADPYYGNRTWSLDDIAVTKGCIGAFCVDDSVITSNNRAGNIVGYFNNGNLVVADPYYGNRTWEQSNVALGFGCTSLFCKGDEVITSNNRSGVVVGFFGDGNIVVNDPYYGNRTWSMDQVALTKAVCANIFIQRVQYCHY